MQAKGTTVKALKDFITENHGHEECRRWLESLPPSAQAIMKERLLPNTWYPFDDALLKPMVAMSQMFYGGKTEGAWNEGRYTAETDLHGVYKVFVKVASPQFLMRNTAVLWHSYYNGSQAQLIEGGKDRAVMAVTGIEPACRDFDQHVAGWIERALEICGCSQIKIAVTNPDIGTTRFDITWA